MVRRGDCFRNEKGVGETYMKRRKQIHYGWVIVLGSFLIAFAAITALTNCLGIFIKPVSEAMGFSRAEFAWYYTFITMTTMLVSPLMGEIIQKFNYRHVVLICSLGSGGALLAFSQCTTLWQFRVVAVVCGVFAGGLNTMSISCIISRWFVRRKATAMAIAFAGSSIGSMVFNPVISQVIARQSWNRAYMLLGGLILVVNVPVSLFLLKNSPADMGLQPYGAEEVAAEGGAKSAKADTISINRMTALRLPYFWSFALSCFFFGLTGSGILQHINSYMTDLGYSVTYAASVVSVSMAIATAAKILIGMLFDRFGGRVGVSVVSCFMVLACTCLVFSGIPGVPYAFSLCYGFAYTVLSISAPNLTAELFGPADYGRIYGVVVMFLSCGMSLGSPLSAMIFDAAGSYGPAWILYGGLSVLGLSIILLSSAGMRRYKQSLAAAT
ncbi:putative MFS-type transporter YhjX [bioreactor metagenome]|uniref:Putative MFS-type transporter YhjX n=1 Tax=bioreactor metagenome TaxID=1076179 RepID=A0A644XUS1_9ZZZZ